MGGLHCIACNKEKEGSDDLCLECLRIVWDYNKDLTDEIRKDEPIMEEYYELPEI